MNDATDPAGGPATPGGCPECLNFAIVGMRELAALMLDGHHPRCPGGLGRDLGPSDDAADRGPRATADYGLISDLVSRLEAANRRAGRLAGALRAIDARVAEALFAEVNKPMRAELRAMVRDALEGEGDGRGQ